jgi:PTH1 family peptidyl-tRNA hydrolase
MADWTMIVGLGNPGRQYENTRHNIGWMALDALATRYSLRYDETQFKAIFAKGTIRGHKVLLVKPQTYMNLSGEAVQPLASFYKIPTERILAVHDDMDIDFGTLRMRAKGSAGGQKGLKSIIQRMGTQEINRLRIGIDRPPGKMPPRAWVLLKFRGDDEILAAQLADRAADAIETWLVSGVELAMTHHNNKSVDDDRVGVVLPPPPKPKPEPKPDEEPVQE